MGILWSSSEDNKVTSLENPTNTRFRPSAVVPINTNDGDIEKQDTQADTTPTSDYEHGLHLSHEELRQRDSEIAILKRELEATKKEKDKLLIRLSAMAGAKLTDNNPNITDLSDRNRPTKLAEKYTELYDNEWTEAFSFLTDKSKKTDKESITILLNLLMETYQICERYTTSKTSDIMTTISIFQQSETSSSEVMKLLKDNRKQNYKLHLEKFKKTMKSELKSIRTNAHLEEEKQKPVNHYISKCAELCFLMTIQDPPVVLDCQTVKDGQPFDKDIYRDYTVRGKKIKFIVWPAVYLHRDGPVLAKGVAQCHKPKRRSSSTTHHSDLSHSRNTTYSVEFSVENEDNGNVSGKVSGSESFGIDNIENTANNQLRDVTGITPRNSLLIETDDKTKQYYTNETHTETREASAIFIENQ